MQRLVYEGHVIAYSEVLHRWQLNERRLELLKYLGHDASPSMTETLHALGGIDEDCQLGRNRNGLEFGREINGLILPKPLARSAAPAESFY